LGKRKRKKKAKTDHKDKVKEWGRMGNCLVDVRPKDCRVCHGIVGQSQAKAGDGRNAGREGVKDNGERI